MGGCQPHGERQRGPKDGVPVLGLHREGTSSCWGDPSPKTSLARQTETETETWTHTSPSPAPRTPGPRTPHLPPAPWRWGQRRRPAPHSRSAHRRQRGCSRSPWCRAEPLAPAPIYGVAPAARTCPGASRRGRCWAGAGRGRRGRGLPAPPARTRHGTARLGWQRAPRAPWGPGPAGGAWEPRSPFCAPDLWSTPNLWSIPGDSPPVVQPGIRYPWGAPHGHALHRAP